MSEALFDAIIAGDTDAVDHLRLRDPPEEPADQARLREIRRLPE